MSKIGSRCSGAAKTNGVLPTFHSAAAQADHDRDRRCGAFRRGKPARSRAPAGASSIWRVRRNTARRTSRQILAELLRPRGARVNPPMSAAVPIFQKAGFSEDAAKLFAGNVRAPPMRENSDSKRRDADFAAERSRPAKFFAKCCSSKRSDCRSNRCSPASKRCVGVKKASTKKTCLGAKFGWSSMFVRSACQAGTHSCACEVPRKAPAKTDPRRSPGLRPRT